MVGFIRNNDNKNSAITRCLLDGLPLPIALFNHNNELIFVNSTFLNWFMYQSPNVFKLSEISEKINLLMSNELDNTLNEVSLNKDIDFVKEIAVRTSINEHKNLKVSFKRIYSDENIDGVSMIFENNPQNDETLAIYKKQAHIDQLTGVLNRFGFHEAFHTINHQVINNNLVYAVLIADIDGLKTINDHQGHLQGDQVIKATANSLSLSLREDDILCRWGGDEFIIILANSFSTKHLSKLLERILARIEKLSKIQNPPINLSIGSAICHVDGESLDELIDHADKKMYLVKQAKLQGST